MTPDTIRSLIEKVEAGSGPDRDLDRDIAKVVGWRSSLAGWRAPEDDFSDPPYTTYPGYCSSIDAAVALTEKLLPGKDWGVERDGEQFFGMAHWDDDHEPVTRFQPDAPRALLSATLRAKLATMEAE